MDQHEEDYELSPNAFWGMTGPQYIMQIAPRELHSRYGMPINDGDAESLGTYVFMSKGGAVVTVYYRANDVWSLLLKLVKPIFWRSKSPVELKIAAENPHEGKLFAQWLSSRFGVSHRVWP
jgi:hypothetical protein